jgi:mRNA-degrading endonuclease YafQ of YafQ-DinJ toxin-antitoxin module
MNILFSESFLRSLKKHSSLREAIKRKVDMVIENPVSLGEPLKGNFMGYYSASIKKNFLIIFYIAILAEKKLMMKLYFAAIVRTVKTIL